MNALFTSEEFKAMSREEEVFAFWCMEAIEAGLVDTAVYQPVTWELVPAVSLKQETQLKTKTTEVDRHLFRSATYTPDFKVRLTQKGVNLLVTAIDPLQLTDEFQETREMYVDTKGSFTVQHAQKQVFELSRKMVYNLYGIWVLKVIPWAAKSQCFFKLTWCPEACRWKKNRKTPEMTTMGAFCKTVGEFLETASSSEQSEEVL